MKKRSIQQEDKTVIEVDVPNKIALQYMKQKITEVKKNRQFKNYEQA